MGIVKTLIDMLFYPIVYIITLLVMALKAVDDGNGKTSAADAVKSARDQVNEIKEAMEDPTRPQNGEVL